MNQQPAPSRISTKIDSRPRGHVTRLVLCVGLLGSAAALVLRPNPVVIGISIGIFAACLLAVIVLALRRASRRIDRIVAEELAPTTSPEKRQDNWRKSA